MVLHGHGRKWGARLAALVAVVLAMSGMGISRQRRSTMATWTGTDTLP
jgi:hypothetical protein